MIVISDSISFAPARIAILGQAFRGDVGEERGLSDLDFIDLVHHGFDQLILELDTRCEFFSKLRQIG
jgi:hypothetical protein